MPTIRSEILIDAQVEACFDAARDVGLHIESAGSTGERIVDGKTRGLLELGEVVTFEGRHFGVRLRLTSKIVEFDRPKFFVDEMQSGPFRRLRHAHRFTDQGGATQMQDEIEFASPLGPIGALVDRLIVGPHLSRFIALRALALKKHLEQAV